MARKVVGARAPRRAAEGRGRAARGAPAGAARRARAVRAGRRAGPRRRPQADQFPARSDERLGQLARDASQDLSRLRLRSNELQDREPRDLAMQPDRFTIKSQEALQAAQRLADERRNPQTTPEHLLAVLLEQPEGIVVPVLRKLGVDPAAVRQTLGIALDALPTLSGGAAARRARRRLERARPGPARRRERDARARRRVRLDRAPAARDRRLIPARPATRCARRVRPRTSCSRRSRRFAAPTASPTRTPRTSFRRSSASAAT